MRLVLPQYGNHMNIHFIVKYFLNLQNVIPGFERKSKSLSIFLAVLKLEQ